MDDDTARRLLEELAEARKQIGTLVAMVGAQAPILREIAPAQKQTTVAELYAAYVKVRQHEHSWAEIRVKLAPLVRRLGGLRVFELTPKVWAEHYSARKQQETRRGKPPADHTVNVELARAKEMIDWGVEAGLVDANFLKPAKKVKTISARETFLTEPQVQELLGGISDLPTMHSQLVTRAFILCALDGLMRFNEVRHLRRDRIGKDGVVELQAKQTKSRKRRTVALTPRALSALEDIPPVLGTHEIFANPDTGRLYAGATIRAWFRVACIASNIDAYAADGERVVIHALRHSGASAADRRGASLRAIQDALGHASIATTSKYVHRESEDGARELAKLMADGAAEEIARDAERRGPRMSPNVSDVGQILRSKQ